MDSRPVAGSTSAKQPSDLLFDGISGDSTADDVSMEFRIPEDSSSSKTDDQVIFHIITCQ